MTHTLLVQLQQHLGNPARANLPMALLALYCRGVWWLGGLAPVVTVVISYLVQWPLRLLQRVRVSHVSGAARL